MVLALLVVVFLVLNALFWGLASHGTHCRLAAKLDVRCPPHCVHLLMGLASYLAAVGGSAALRRGLMGRFW